ncbi:Hint domain-containing protein [Oceanicola sp. S124]|uniref:Hint domain-containing protein n=1 Tax=Oceanicola sp. S124 TaxID=1042378 RepID=UPI00025593FD|nr:Hint domain-containing protein [Oceanicola sp. S124]
MSPLSSQTPAMPATAIPVFLASALAVVHGVNEGDALSFADELVPDDIYWFSPRTPQSRMMVEMHGSGEMRVAEGSPAGVPGMALHLDSCLIFMSPDGTTTEILVLVAVDEEGDVDEVYALPLAPLLPRHDYRLVGIDRQSAPRKFAEVGCVSFTRGTMITMASGAQKPIEALEPGDRVLTRDHGAQEVRWIGQMTHRATGEFAPIVIRAGVLSNTDDLVVSPEHRLFIYQRQDALGLGRKEVLVRARHLVNGDTIYRQDGGFVDYFQLLFDRHEIIYAEGIAAETLLLDTRTIAALPPEIDPELGRTLARALPQHHRTALAFEVAPTTLERPDALKLLREATRGQLPPDRRH